MELTIAQLRELIDPQPLSVSPCPPSDRHGICLVIADRGHVWVGNVSTSADWCLVENASVVRVWGTTKGLGEIAEGGPTSKTVLDKCGSVRVARRALIALIPCKEHAWKL